MPGQAPPIYTEDPVEATAGYLQAYSRWRPADPAAGAPDLGEGLVHLFGRLAEVVADRLNQVPEKNFRAFLALIGTAPQPPEPAIVPVTFTLASGTAGGALVPGNTRLAAGQVIFETEEDLFAAAANVVAAYTRDPLIDRWSHHDLGGSFPAFGAMETDAHRLYIASELFAVDAAKTVNVQLAAAAAPWLSAVTWEASLGGGWAPITPDPHSPPGTIALESLPALPQTSVGGTSAPWIRATLTTSVPRSDLADPSAASPTLARSGVAFDTVITGVDGQILRPSDPTTAFAPLPEVTPGAFVAFACQEAFSKPGAVVTLRVTATQPPPGRSDITLQWEYSTAAGGWRTLTVEVSADGNSATGAAQPTRAFVADGTISFVSPSDWGLDEIGGVSSLWLRATTTAATYTAPQTPSIGPVVLDYTWDLPVLGGDARGAGSLGLTMQLSNQDLRPEQAFADQTPIDLNRDFFPFGESPQFNDVLYLASSEAFGGPQKQITVNVAVTNAGDAGGTPPPAKPSADLALVWEYWDARGVRWSPLTVDEDTTQLLCVNGDVKFTMPATAGAVDVNGVSADWIRVRISRGNYGEPAHYEPDPTAAPTAPPYKLVLSTLAPPSLKSLSIDYTTTAGALVPPEHVLVENDFSLADHTSDAAAGNICFLPFTPMTAPKPTLYLGFDQPLPDQQTSVLMAVTSAPHAGRVTVELYAGAPPAVVWEYWNGIDAQWAHLPVDDESRSFTREGLVKFVIPVTHSPTVDFGMDPTMPLWWLRARWEGGDYPGPVWLDRVLTRTVWAANATTSQNEVLGSSTGEPGQVMTLSRTPVLNGEVIQVRESDRSSPAELAALAAEVGEAAIAQVTDPATGVTALWVQWTAVTDFYGSGPRSRDYILDRVSGQVQFGDGQQGMIPPAGRANVRAGTYRSGGGEVGNVASGAISQLKSAVPYVQGVTNQQPAEGGTEAEGPDTVRERGPKRLRHGERATTAVDFSDLALESSGAVARALTVPAAEQPGGEVGVVVVMRSLDPKPAPTLELLSEVEDYLGARLTPTFDLWVAGPGFVQVTVTAEVVPSSLADAAQVEADTVSALTAFLHPLYGGQDGNGWPFGRRPHRSDLLSRILAVRVVDHVRALHVEEQPVDDPPSPDATLIYSGSHTITVSGGD